jgi:signal recognition particle subunit SRP54
MFNYLTKSLSGILDSLKRKGILTEDDIKTALREIRISLIEADVALPAIKHVISKISEKALGAEVLKSITPDQMIVKIVHDELIEILKHKGSKLELNFPAPVIIVMAGLQGAGKTTTTAKIALKIKNTTRKKVLLASVDTRRPAARKQLEVLGKQIDVATVSIIDNENPIDITTRALKEAKYGNYDVLIIDTAGRSSINEELISVHYLVTAKDEAHEVQSQGHADVVGKITVPYTDIRESTIISCLTKMYMQDDPKSLKSRLQEQLDYLKNAVNNDVPWKDQVFSVNF